MSPRERGGVSRRKAESQIRNPRLIKQKLANIASSSGSNPEFLQHKAAAAKQQSEENKSSYANAEESEDGSYVPNPLKEIILLIENKDLEWKDQPWTLMQRYLGTDSYPTVSYKHRYYYEHILMDTDSCQFVHYTNCNSTVYNFSKAIIKQIISAESWGISPLQEKWFIDYENKVILKYNYYDYVNAFCKAFLYENQKKKHSWLFKICSEVYKQNIPNWFYKWWLSYGPSIKILPEPYKGLYNQWVETSPYLIESQNENGFIEGMPLLHYFTQFEIPWIWKWSPEVGYTTQQIPCINRIFFTKFWKKMLCVNKEGVMESQETVNKIRQAIISYKEQIKM